MKIAKITPIYEKGDEKKCNNHRPIAILPISSEVIELAIKKKDWCYFRNNGII